jgi:hypothetical protein
MVKKIGGMLFIMMADGLKIIFRMDHYPYKDKMYIKIIREDQKKN